MRKGSFMTLIGTVVLLLGLSIPMMQCAPSGGEVTLPDETVPIAVDLEMSKAPKLNEIVELTCTVSSVSDMDMPNCVANVELPEGAIKVDGDLSWSGAIEKDIPVQFSATIKFIEEGEWGIKGTATEILDDGNSWGDVTAIYLIVTEDEGRFLEKFEDRPVKSAPMENEKPIDIDLSMSTFPGLDQDAEFTCVVKPAWDLPNTTVKTTLPEGATLVSGDLTWQGDLKAGNSVSLSATIRFTETGNWAIETVAKSIIDEDNSWSDVDCIHLNVGATKGTCGFVYPPGEEAKAKAVQSSPGDGQLVPESIEEEELEFPVEIPEDPPAVEPAVKLSEGRSDLGIPS